MKTLKILISLWFLSTLFSSTLVLALDETPLYQWVLQIRAYKYDPSSGLYALVSYGSSVSLGWGKLITNAHVIFDDDAREPYGTYEACQSISFEREPKCFSLAKLESYDLDNDLALLTLDKRSPLPKLPLSSEKKYKIGAPLIIYGYPGIGGATTTRTAGRIAGYDEPFYKIDGIVDRGNSGGGAFSLSGELVGIPSRLITDNASLGYMIPTSTVLSFLAKKTAGYTKYSEPLDSAFRAFLTKKYSEVTSNYVFRNAIVSIGNMRKYGVKFVKNIVTNASDTQVFLTFLHEKKKVQFFLMCGKVAGSSSALPYWKEEMSKDSEIVASNRARFTTVREYIQKDQYSYIIFDTKSPCFIIPATYIDPKKDKTFLSDLERFLDEGISNDIHFDTSWGFAGSLFSIAKLPEKMLVVEYPNSIGKSTVGVYLENSLAKSSSALVRSYTFDREKDMVSALAWYGDVWDDPKLADLGALLEKNRWSTETILSGSTLSGQKYYISYDRSEKAEKWKLYASLSAVILSTSSDQKYGYMRFSWSEYDPWLDDAEIEKIHTFFSSLSLRDQK